MKCGIAICTYNRGNQLAEVLEAVLATTKGHTVVVCDDGSTEDGTADIVRQFGVPFISGPNRGVAYNKNRALVTLQNCDYLAILEDDLIPVCGDWVDIYRKAAEHSGIHHFCRVQDNEIEETVPEFQASMQAEGLTPIYGPNVRGDLTFITRRVLTEIGAFNPEFIGVGYGHKEWSDRVYRAGLIPHPLKWVDIKEARDSFVQKGDTEGGRWERSKKSLQGDLKRNRAIYRKLKASQYIYHPLGIM